MSGIDSQCEKMRFLRNILSSIFFLFENFKFITNKIKKDICSTARQAQSEEHEDLTIGVVGSRPPFGDVSICAEVRNKNYFLDLSLNAWTKPVKTVLQRANGNDSFVKGIALSHVLFQKF